MYCTVETAKLHGIKSSFIFSDFLHKRAILEALEIEKSLNRQKVYFDRLSLLVDNIEEGAIIFNSEHAPVFYNDNAIKILVITSYHLGLIYSLNIY